MQQADLEALPALELAGADNLREKIVIDISNPLDFSKGFPPTLSVVNDDSLGEQIQRAFPEAKVVKGLNTVTAALMVNPGQLTESLATRCSTSKSFNRSRDRSSVKYDEKGNRLRSASLSIC
jgi:hypothetical protein